MSRHDPVVDELSRRAGAGDDEGVPSQELFAGRSLPLLDGGEHRSGGEMRWFDVKNGLSRILSAECGTGSQPVRRPKGVRFAAADGLRTRPTFDFSNHFLVKR